MTNDEITLNIIKKSKKNLTAYEILEKFQKTKKVQPMTVYRSLNKLIEKHKIHKSNLNKTYILCSHKHKDRNTFIAICDICGRSEELLNNIFSSQVKKLKLQNFKISDFKLEILTKCRSC